jgi:RNA polymerase sigma factor (TIGR02999 family)
MRDILADHFRSQQAAKRGGSHVGVPLEDAHGVQKETQVDFLALNEAIDGLAVIKPRYARIIEMRFIAGLTVEETAEVLRISDATVEREWTFARLWLRRALRTGKP